MNCSIKDVEENDFELTVKKYIEQKKQDVISPERVERDYFLALNAAKEAENKMKTLLVKGGYLNV